MTSGKREPGSMTSRQIAHLPHASPLSRCSSGVSQRSAAAVTRARVVFPRPELPENSSWWGSVPADNERRSARTGTCWPTTSANLRGRYCAASDAPRRLAPSVFGVLLSVCLLLACASFTSCNGSRFSQLVTWEVRVCSGVYGHVVAVLVAVLGKRTTPGGPKRKTTEEFAPRLSLVHAFTLAEDRRPGYGDRLRSP